jgi:hypothetical protein
VNDLDDDRLYWGTDNPANPELYIKGLERPVEDVLADRMIEFINVGAPIDSFIEFCRNCEWNPNYESVEDLYAFLQHNGHPITRNGLFVGYRVVTLAPYYARHGFKSAKQVGWSYRIDIRDDMDTPYVDNVRVDPDTGEVIEEKIDLTQQLRFVDRFTKSVDNSVGQAPRMPREEVTFDRNQTCEHGYHIAALSYLPHYGAGSNAITSPPDKSWTAMTAEEQYNWIKRHDVDPVTENLVHPADVVSVPVDYGRAKMRTCGYYVHNLFNGAREEPYTPLSVGYATWVEEKLTEELGPKPEVDTDSDASVVNPG